MKMFSTQKDPDCHCEWKVMIFFTPNIDFITFFEKLSFSSRLSHVIQFATQESKVYGDHLARQMKFVLSHDWLLYIQLVVVNSRQTVSFCSTNSLLALTAVIWCSAILGTTALLIVAVLGTIHILPRGIFRHFTSFPTYLLTLKSLLSVLFY